MNEEINKKIQELYDSIMYFPNKVLEIFNDFFGEERVDMQGFPDLEGLRVVLNECTLQEFFPNKAAVTSCPEFIGMSKEHKDMIMTLLDNGALQESVLSNNTLATYFLPILNTVLSSKLPIGFILIHFPEVRVTNEHDRYVDITHLWVKVDIKFNGSGVGWFGMNRSEYPMNHMQSDYMHSHISCIPFNDFTEFKSPCLGQGPIKSTVATLAMGYDEAMWQLFCLELDKYVTVESVAGVPYRYLERIGSTGSRTLDTSTFNMNSRLSSCSSYVFDSLQIKSFIKYLINNNKFKFNFINGSYGIAMTYLEYRIMLSNEFIKWYNEQFNKSSIDSTYLDLKVAGIIKECIIVGNKVYVCTNQRSNRDYLSYEGKLVCNFKGKPVTVHIIESIENEENRVILINSELVSCITKGVLYVVNYKYGRKEGDAGINTPVHYL